MFSLDKNLSISYLPPVPSQGNEEEKPEIHPTA
jgi:hypothetical protein